MQSEHKDNNIDLNAISLKRGKGQNLHDTQRGIYWHIMFGDVRVGKIYIDYHDNEVLGYHPAIDIFINQTFQGKHIGRRAYHLACEQSGLDEIYMHTRKSNIASIKAAYEAGFRELNDKSFRQIVMVWKKVS